jgi:hypothetical protein
MLVVAWAGIASAHATEVATYSIANIEYSPTPLQQVGKVRAGLLCLPKGILRWRDVARPEQSALVARVESALGAGGLSVAPQPDPLYGDPLPLTRYRIRVRIETVSLRICTAGDVLIIGKVGRAPYTQGMIQVRWETFDRSARQRIDTATYAIPVSDHAADARTASHVLSNAIEASAGQYATSRPR